MEAVAVYQVLPQKNIAIISLNRPNSKNAFNDELYQECVTCLDKAVDDDRVSVVILTGSGDYFSSGADIKGMTKFQSHQSIATQPAGLFMKMIMAFPKLLVAVVNGPAVGIGVTILPHCDFVACTPKATFWTPFSRVAISPELCSSVTFPALMGTSMATDMLLFGKLMTAPEALKIGLVMRIFPLESILDNVIDTLENSLFSLPFGHESALAYKQLMLASRLPIYSNALQIEFDKNDERFAAGEPQVAVTKLRNKVNRSML